MTVFLLLSWLITMELVRTCALCINQSYLVTQILLMEGWKSVPYQQKAYSLM